MGKVLHHCPPHCPVPPQLVLAKEYLVREQLEVVHDWFKDPAGHGGAESGGKKVRPVGMTALGQALPRASTSDRGTRAPDGQEGGDLPETRL